MTKILEKEFTKEDIESAKSEISDKYLRLYAEFENYKKRTSKEKEDIKNYTKLETLSAVLDVDNDLSIAIQKMESKSEGLNLILSKVDKFLKSQGIETIQTDTYDENIHEVVSVVPSENGDIKIVEIVSRGYTLNDRIIRYPKVILSK